MNGPVLIRHETYEHPFTHTKRCCNPLIYRSVSSWFSFQGDGPEDRMVELKPADHVVSRTRQGTASSASGCRARDYSIPPGIATGVPRFRHGSPTTHLPKRIDKALRQPHELERDFGVRPAKVTVSSTSLPVPT